MNAIPENDARSGETENTTKGDIVSEQEILARIPVSRRTLRTWRTNGVIPAIIINRRVLYHWPSVQSTLLRKQREGAQ